jgi:ubiquinone/menaquinone biosynthesis C-methylase UbiE
MGSLSFDADTGARLERLYTAADVRRRRALATSALSLVDGDRVLDIGCGPGFHTAELAAGVGPNGVVTGVDISETMLAIARERCAELPNSVLLTGSATDLPVPDQSVDAAVAVQVLEYVEDIGTALGELRRVLVPGGRVAIIDVDWSTLSWHSSDTERMRAIVTTWDQHLAHPSLPRWLGAALKDAGFMDVAVVGHSFVNTSFDPDGYSYGLLPIVSEFAKQNHQPREVVDAWASDLEARANTDTYFFSVTKFLFTATAPSPNDHP